MNASQIQQIVIVQKKFFNTGKTLSICYRITQLKRLKNALLKYETELANAIAQDLHRNSFDTFMSEIYICITEINTTIKNINQWASPTKIKNSLLTYSTTNYTYPQPYGIALIIAPWNFPIQLLIMPLIGAIAAGNCAVLKPSEFCKKTTTVLMKLFDTTFDPAFIKLIIGDKNLGQLLIEQEFDYIFFTGSPSVGKKIAKSVAEHLTPITLELGGKNPCIVDANVNIKQTAKKIAWAKFFNAGQNCMAPDYVLVNQTMKELFINEIILNIKEFYGKNTAQSDAYCRIINDQHYTRLEKLLHGRTIRYGGKANAMELYIEPTIIECNDFNDPLMLEEIFGPILPILHYNSIEDIILELQKMDKPLTLYLFSNDKKIQEKYINNSYSGTICINDLLVPMLNTQLPFGGLGKSGYGNYHGKKSFDTFSHYKSVSKVTSTIFSCIRFPPYGKLQKIFMKILKKCI